MEKAELERIIHALKGPLIEALKEPIDASIDKSVNKYVNGKINKLSEKVDGYITEDIQWKKDDKAWKDNAQPTVTLGSRVITGSLIFKWILITGASIGGFLAAINVIKNFFNL